MTSITFSEVWKHVERDIIQGLKAWQNSPRRKPTYYHFRNDNAPALQLTTDEPFFSFVACCDFSGAHQRFDQCGVVMYLDSENWVKGSVEYENDEFCHLGSVVTNHGWSDWATTEVKLVSSSKTPRSYCQLLLSMQRGMIA
ncbi:MAG: DUF1349 domain-containing protein [Coriobacteriales bacterium]|nr:DUF1349 domain-containing protein [Coriobacteriales bacterium]